jgi:flagellar motor switch protein FliM
MLSATPASKVKLRCGEVELYIGAMGRKGQNMAVKIEERLITTEEG